MMEKKAEEIAKKEAEQYMKRAISLAKKGRGFVNPNPMVGAVIVKEGKILGEGYHRQYGGLHGERNAIAACSGSPKGATLYVTLEPCCHHGKTPPCTEAIIREGISRVVIGSLDPNPLVSGKGISILKQAGIVVEQGILEEECDGLNQVFFHYISTGRPYVVMKYAMTLDGKIATKTGASKWITGEEARRRVHEDRHNYSGILVGVGTVIADDPLLTCRLPKGKNPVRIICDSKLRTPLDAQVVVTAGEIETIIATCSKDQQKQQSYEAAGCTVLVVPDKGGRVALKPLLEALGKRKIDSVLLEGGGTLNGEALAEGIVDKVQAYISPKIFGGEKAKSPVGGRGVGLPAEAYRLEKIKVSTWGEDLLLEGEVKR